MWKVAFEIRDNLIQASSSYAGPSKGDFQIVLPSGWNLLSVTLWCLHPGHCYSSTHLLYNFVHYIQFNQFGKEHFFVRAKRALRGPDLAVPYRAFSSLH